MKEEETTYHVPVLLKESVDAMNISPDGTYVDVTFGGGGHSREILSRLGDGGRLLGFDQDEDAERNIVNDPHFTFVRSNFRYLHNFLRYHDIGEVDAILADLGVSSHHFDDSERGFSFRFDGKLDMRMNKRAGITAADVVNTYEEERLADIFYLYGELKNSRKLASVIVKARTGQKIETIGEFLEIIKPLFGREREKKELAKVFQALRIEVNQEMEALKEMLMAATEALKPGGRLVVITYHSLEDRMVKNIMKTGNVEGSAKIPYIIKWPSAMTTQAIRGKRIEQPVELRDFLPTFIELAGGTVPDDMDGKSLVALASGNKNGWRKYIDLEHATCYSADNYWCALTDGKMKYIWFIHTGEEQLFDLSSDPGEQKNLSGNSRYADRLVEMRKAMVDHLQERGTDFVKDGKLAVRDQTLLYSPNYPKD